MIVLDSLKWEMPARVAVTHAVPVASGHMILNTAFEPSCAAGTLRTIELRPTARHRRLRRKTDAQRSSKWHSGIAKICRAGAAWNNAASAQA